MACLLVNSRGDEILWNTVVLVRMNSLNAGGKSFLAPKWFRLDEAATVALALLWIQRLAQILLESHVADPVALAK